MVTTTDVAQLSQECNAWRESLRAFRDLFTHLKQDLQHQARLHRQKEDLLQVEHFDNQFHIQLINIHDLKQQIKHHDRKLTLAAADSGITDSLVTEHESLHGSFADLELTLQDIREDFARFTAKA